ncbi:hypothetical protein TorRG33x02_191350 [Trema orientale]|uniref:Uncharacterized protein n=1 Tax=Trema orientale TaxID=63057 RepID=A0A2P5EHL3_TREOI|nr:hypothetical protein TorRG33x02_191350 [Trema orientale]
MKLSLKFDEIISLARETEQAWEQDLTLTRREPGTVQSVVGHHGVEHEIVTGVIVIPPLIELKALFHWAYIEISLFLAIMVRSRSGTEVGIFGTATVIVGHAVIIGVGG